MAGRKAAAPAPERALDACALLAGLLVGAAVYAPRLPADPAFLLPQKAGGGILLAFASVLRRPWAPAALSYAALLAVALCALALGWSVVARAKKGPPVSRALLAVAGAAGVAVLARLTLVTWLDVVANAWFMPESLDLREPLLLAGLFCGVFALALRAASAFAVWCVLSLRNSEAAEWALPAGRLAAAWLTAFAAARGVYDAGFSDLSAAVGGAGEERPALVAVFSGDDGGPEPKVLAAAQDGDLSAVEAYLDAHPRSVYRRAALGRLYAGCTIAMDASCLRRALSRGLSAGDPYARLLALEHLQSAPAGEEGRALLAAVSDERRFRAGPRAAARLALAAARQGDEEAARRWLARASQGEGALPPGLVELPARPGPLKPGRISGRLRAKGGAVVALYARAHPGQPSLLGPGQLAGTSQADASGRFRFEGLPAGDYYLAAAVTPSGPDSRRRLRVLGRRGDLTLSARRPALDGLSLELRD